MEKIVTALVEHALNYKPYTKRIWVIATIFGTMWGSLEITLGAFIHNLRIPLGGLLMVTITAFILTMVAQIYPLKGVLIRIGLIAALCKALSPGGLILAPMLAIFVEATIAEIVYRYLGVHILSALLVGMLLPLWSFFQKIFISILLYGWGTVEIYIGILKMLQRAVGLTEISLAIVVVLFFALIAFGVCGSLGGLYFFAKKQQYLLAWQNVTVVRELMENEGEQPNDVGVEQSPPKMFVLAFLAISACAFVSQFMGYFAISVLGLSALVILVYIFQKQILIKFGNRKFWGFSLLIVLLSGLFLGKDVEYLANIPISIQGVVQGCGMVVRAAILYLLILSFSRLFAPHQYNAFFKKLRQEHLGPILKRSFDLLPKFVFLFREQLEQHRKRQQSGWGVDFLVSVFTTAIALANENGLQIFVITGHKESGKTTCINKIANILQQQVNFKAILQPRIVEQGQTTGYNLLLLPQNRQLALATKKNKQHGYAFRNSAFREAAKMLHGPPEVDIFLVDELGKLELAGGGHFSCVFRKMHTYGGLWILTMREEYSQKLATRLRSKFTQKFSLCACQ